MNNKLNRQENEVLAILKACGRGGMNSYTWRPQYVQLPARIFGLKKAGYLVTTRRLKNGSVDYLLASEPEQASRAPEMVWDYSGNTARLVAKGQPKQEINEHEQRSLF